MKSKKIILVTSMIIILIIIIFGFFYRNSILEDSKKIIFNYNTEGKNKIVFDSIKNYKTVSCNFNFFKPQIAYVEYFKRDDNDFEDLGVSFYNFKKEN